ncbi:dna polymerase i, partial [Cystoisospora suis]
YLSSVLIRYTLLLFFFFFFSFLSERVRGIPSVTLPGFTKLLGGFRRGELSVWTGGTGIGKTTILCQLSIDFCLQGVPTLWGSFEVNNIRLLKTMLRQFSGGELDGDRARFDFYANKFSSLPLYFLKFHGSTHVD